MTKKIIVWGHALINFPLLCQRINPTSSMWTSLGKFILKYRLFLLLILVAITAFMVWHASKVELSYEFARAIPTSNPKYKEYQEFRKKFGEEGNLLVIGIQTDQLFAEKMFNEYSKLL